MIVIHCPCRKWVWVEEDSDEGSTPCPRCHATLTVPRPAPELHRRWSSLELVGVRPAVPPQPRTQAARAATRPPEAERDLQAEAEVLALAFWLRFGSILVVVIALALTQLLGVRARLGDIPAEVAERILLCSNPICISLLAVWGVSTARCLGAFTDNGRAAALVFAYLVVILYLAAMYVSGFPRQVTMIAIPVLIWCALAAHLLARRRGERLFSEPYRLSMQESGPSRPSILHTHTFDLLALATAFGVYMLYGTIAQPLLRLW